jgi:hypothetical protein
VKPHFLPTLKVAASNSRGHSQKNAEHLVARPLLIAEQLVARPLGSLDFDLAQHSPTTRPSVERTAEEAFMLSDRSRLAHF